LEEKITEIGIVNAVPMVCFCDIPLSQIEKHVDFYGKYGVGLRKEWAISQKLNPVMYLSSSSKLSDNLSEITQILAEFDKGIGNSAITSEYLKKNGFLNITEIRSFTKPIKGLMYRNGNFVERYFYDEREWRYVPNLDIDSPTFRMFKDDFMQPITRAKANSDLQKIDKLVFGIDDIKYLLVESNKDIPSLIDTIKNIYKAETSDKIEILFTKIMTVEQIRDDF